MLPYKAGKGLLNGVINKFPFEAHLPGYQYCGPGTKLEKRLARGDPGINLLDVACKKHDITYHKYPNGPQRIEADKVLSSEAWNRVLAKDSSVGEKAAALTVTGAMKAKIGMSKLGKGLKRLSCMKNKKKKKTMKKCSFKSLVSKTRKSMRGNSSTSANDIIKSAIFAAKNIKKESTVPEIRIIPIPKSGGMLPLVPIFAGLSALGSLVGGVSAVVNAIRSTNEGKRSLLGNQRIEGGISIGKSKNGEGLYLQPYKKGYGLFLKPYPNTSVSKNF